METTRIEPVPNSAAAKGNAVETPAWAAQVFTNASAHLKTKHGDKTQTHRLLEATEDDLGFTHVKLRRTYRGLPVIGLDSIVEFDKDGNAIDTLSDNDADLSQTALVPELTVEQAARIASGDGTPFARTPETDAGVLVIFAALGHKPTLCWQVTDTTKNSTVYVDAVSGNEVYRDRNFDSADSAAPVNMTTTYSGFVYRMTGTYNSGIWYAKDITRGYAFVENQNFSYNPYQTLNIYGIVNNNDSTFNFSTLSTRAVGDALFGYEQIWDYFQNVHGRNGWDGNGTGMGIVVGWPYIDGAFFNGDKGIRFGSTTANANGKTMATVDFVGHEFTHAVTFATAGLSGAGESGSLNESFSDIFGTAAEFYSRRLNTYSTPALSASYMNDRPAANFLWAEGTGLDSQIPNTTTTIVRSLQDPPSRINSFSGLAGVDRYENLIVNGGIDSGGVHLNCGIQNKVYYLLSVGGTAYGTTVQSIGRDKAEKIFFRTLTLPYLTTYSGFIDARYATCRAASDLYGYGSSVWWQVWLAWDAVGVPQSRGFPQN